MNMITEYPQFTYSKNRFYSTESEDEAKAFAIFWGGSYKEIVSFESEDEAKAFAIFWGGSYKEIVSFPNNYFKIEI